MTSENDLIRFASRAMDVAEELGGSIGREGRAFSDQLKVEWTATGKPLTEADAWLRERLKDVFVSVGETPVWVTGEPAWLYDGDQPMVFVTQAKTHPVDPNGVVYL